MSHSNYFKKISICVCYSLTLVLVFIAPASAKVNLKVSRPAVMLNETLQLEFIADGQVGKDLQEPNWKALEKDFRILNTKQSYSFQSIGGKNLSITKWQLEVVPKRVGKIQIPSLSFGSAASPAKFLVVKKPPPAPAQKKQRDIYIDVLVNPPNPYVQQEVQYTLKIFMAKNLRGNISQPSFSSNVLSKPLPERRYRVNQGGKNYEVYERTYMLYPQQSGKVTIKPIALTGSYIERNRRFNVNEKSKTVNLQVQPAPDAFDGKAWFPSSHVRLEEKWSSPPEDWQQGQALTRTVKLIGRNLLAQQLPKIEIPSLPSFNVYAETNVSLNTVQANKGFNGVSTQKFVLIPTQDGEQKIPAIEVPWWNIDKGRQEVASLPARTVQIKAAPARQQAMPNSNVSDFSPNEVKQGGQVSSFWFIISIVLLLLWLLTLGLAYQKTVRKGILQIKAYRSQRARLKEIYKEIQTAGRMQDAATMRTAIMRWAHEFWQEDTPNTYARIKQRCTPGLRLRLDKFDNAVYAKEGGRWDGESLYQALLHEPHPSKQASSSTSASKLEPMYKT